MSIKHNVTILILAGTLTAMTGCATSYQAQGSVAGGTMGGLAGAILDQKNPWRGGVIGATLGAIAGATISEISVRGARETASAGRPVEYRTDDGRGYYRADPMDGQHTRCKKVRERIYENDKLVKDRVREVCVGERFDRGY